MKQLEQTQLFDLSKAFSLSGDQPVKVKQFIPPVQEQKTSLFGKEIMRRDYNGVKNG